MILVDTNVISEPLRKAAEPRVIDWIDAQPLETLYLSAVTVAELRFGVASLPAGRRRGGLQESLERRVLPLFAGRVLAFDLPASQSYAELMAKARAAVQCGVPKVSRSMPCFFSSLPSARRSLPARRAAWVTLPCVLCSSCSR
jgi:predicted nucleic acid-binding protein